MAPQARLRTALFRVDGHKLSRVISWDGMARNRRTKLKPLLLDLDQQYRSIASFSFLTGQIAVVDNAEVADADATSPFRYFSVRDRHVIRSILSIPIRDSQNRSEFVLCVDSEVPGTFSESRKDEYSLLQRMLSDRIIFHTQLWLLLSRKSTKHR